MGVKGLSTFISKNYSECISIRHLIELKDKVVAFDLPCLAYRFWYGSSVMRKNNNNNNNNKQNILQHVSNSLDAFVRLMRRNGIKAIYVAEGVAPKCKRDTITRRNASARRSKKHTQQHQVYVQSSGTIVHDSEDGDDDEDDTPWSTMKKKKSVVCSESNTVYRVPETQVNHRVDFNFVQEYLKELGETVILSPNEAETMCAAMIHTRMVDVVYSRDYDMLAYDGVDMVVFSISLPKGTFTCVDVTKLLNNMGMTRRQFIDFCILCSTDYNRSIPGIHPKRAFNLIKECTTLDVVLQTHKLEKYLDPDKTAWVRHLFGNADAYELVSERNRGLYCSSNSGSRYSGRVKLDRNMLKKN
ncbi:40.8 kDa FEN-1/FLAP-like endonuclease XPG N-I domain [Spodoptera frugiperda ascovirus 1a]|uniref:40.8 kDa FEN-1/FLAP-like endonuclease XPG N-I domain n=1 Tax=Spodoptera frugiperda ascovirus 1a TaxID=113370 RepID=Q0E535_SFAVA|nr:40.8 kDa FEN-1/FLAP-like endonuclease XPG N-I domain [Spodoptera frugiperda ascovirus 1a]CAL44666.1 40.8 kDa FEN-1/FLAP-like endonuclease XPG N-I domain [Spodoptera frugiperda ascovirus 1a]